MKKMKIRFMAVVLVVALIVKIVYTPLPVYADEYTDATIEVLWDLIILASSVLGQVVDLSKGDLKSFIETQYLVDDKWGNDLTFDEWVLKNTSKSDDGNIQYSEDLVKFIMKALETYAQQHPDEVEKIDYMLIKTNTQTGAVLGDLSLKTAFTLHEGESVNVTDGYSELDRFRLIWQLQSEYEEFPELYYISYAGILPADSEKVQSVNFNQYLRFFRGYEHNRVDATKVSCFIGNLDSNSMKACTFGLYTYDYSAGALVNDRMQGVLQQYSGTYSSGEWSLTTGSRSANAESSFASSMRFSADVDLDSGLITIPGLITQEGKIYRMFATEQDALRYFETCANSGLNFDPNQVYTGGSVTINNNGDVTINNNPPGGGDDEPGPGSDSSGILGVLQDIRDWVKKIYNQVVIGNVINAIDALANVLDTAKNYFDEALEDTAAVAALSEGLSNKFPLSIPADILAIVTVLEAPPQDPVFIVPFKADFGGATGIKIDEEWVLDFTMFDSAIEILKWWLSLMYLWGLVMITPKFILMINGVSGSGGGKN